MTDVYTARNVVAIIKDMYRFDNRVRFVYPARKRGLDNDWFVKVHVARGDVYFYDNFRNNQLYGVDVRVFEEEDE